jgi:segregation and condensation protein B
MSDHPLMNVVEAVLLAAGRPVTIAQLLELFEEHERPAAEDISAALAALSERFDGTGVELREVASGWRVQVRQQYADVVSRLWQERPSRYSRALLETLALIAYRQPITRGEIEDIRGVTVASTIMRTLHERSWIRVVGHREVPGRPELLGTTREFLDYFGLKSLDDLPTLAELQDLDDLNEQLELPGTPVAAIAADEVTGMPPPATVAVTVEEIVAEVFDDSAEEPAEDESISDDPVLDAAGGRDDGEVPTLVAGPPDSQER